MNKKRIATIAAFLLMVASLAFLFFGPTAFGQLWRMRKARQHLPAITLALEPRAELHEITAGAGTGGGGCILVVGHVATQAHLESLKSLIASTKPPVTVMYAVSVAENPK